LRGENRASNVAIALSDRFLPPTPPRDAPGQATSQTSRCNGKRYRGLMQVMMRRAAFSDA
jgi:hypothetical protein